MNPLALVSVTVALSVAMGLAANATDNLRDCPPPPRIEQNALLMKNTFRLQGPKKNQPDRVVLGTAFLLTRPFPGVDPGGPKGGRLTLITAKHVLQDIGGSRAAVVTRRQGSNGSWVAEVFWFSIRDGDTPLWTEHPTADVAAMYFMLPDCVAAGLGPGPSTDMLASANDFELYRLHPGDEVNILGFPTGASSAGMFPILRSGRIASYLDPGLTGEAFLVDFENFGGNSGGPVYAEAPSRWRADGRSVSTFFLIIGLASQEALSAEDRTPLKLGHVVHSAKIRETIARLPPTDPLDCERDAPP